MKIPGGEFFYELLLSSQWFERHIDQTSICLQEGITNRRGKLMPQLEKNRFPYDDQQNNEHDQENSV